MEELREEREVEENKGKTSEPEPKAPEAKPGEEQGAGRRNRGREGEAGGAQCLSVAPQRGLETRHNGCTVSGRSPALSSLSDTRTLPFLNQQHNNLFSSAPPPPPRSKTPFCAQPSPFETSLCCVGENRRLSPLCCSSSENQETAGVENIVVH